jgi:MFS family permease
MTKPPYALRTPAYLPAIVMVAVCGLGLSLMLPLLALEMERLGVSSFAQGLQAALAGIAIALTAPFVPALAARFGVRRVIMAALALAITTTLLFKALPSMNIWLVLRLVFGAALGTLFTLSEYWIVSTAPEARRGLIMGAYATILATCFAIGPALLALTGSAGWPAYALAALCMLTALVPLLLAPVLPPPSAPRDGTGGRMAAVGRTIAMAPGLTLAAFLAGFAETAGMSHLAVIGVRTGYSESAAALLVSLFAAGNVVMQIPAGLLSDRMDRQRLLVLLAVAGAAALAVFAFALSAWPALSMAALFLAGGAVGALYTVGLAGLGARFSGLELATANAAFVMLYSSGLTVGPLIAGAGLDLAGPVGFAGAIVVCLAGYISALLRRPAA